MLKGPPLVFVHLSCWCSMTTDSSLLSAQTKWVWITLQKGSPFSKAFGLTQSKDGPLQLQCSSLALSPSCWFSSICLLCRSPKVASIKSPLKMITGLDSYKLEQNNISQTPMSSLAPHPNACSYLSHIISSRGPEHCCETWTALVYWCTLYWCELIPSGHTFGCHTPCVFPCVPSTAYAFTPMHLLWQGTLGPGTEP